MIEIGFPIYFEWSRDIKRPQAIRMVWHSMPEIERFLSAPCQGIAVKDHLPWWGPMTCEGDYRAADKVTMVTAIVHDVDAPFASWAEAVAHVRAALPEIAFAMHPSFSSTPSIVKVRVIVFLPRAMTVEEHALAWPVVLRMLENRGVIADPSCKDPSRAFFVPAIPPNGFYEWHIEAGEAFDLEFALECARGWQEEERAAVTSNVISETAARAFTTKHGTTSTIERARSYLAKVPGAVSGQSGHAHTFTMALRLVHGFDLDADTALALLSEWNLTCDPPWSDRDLRRKIKQAAEQGRAESGFMLRGGR